MKNRSPEKLFVVSNARLDLRSLVKLFAFVGFFAGFIYGIGSILYAVATDARDGFLGLRILMGLISPLNFSIASALSAVIGYPLYQYFINRYLSLSLSGYELYEK